MSDEPPRPARQDIPDLSGRVIDIMVYGGSRPDLLREMLPTLREHVTFTGRLRLLYQDCNYNPERALECLRIVEEFGGFEVARIYNPDPDRPGVMSYGYSITAALDDLIRAPLFFHLEEDHRFLRRVDLDVCWDLFAEHAHLNQLRYNRRKNPAEENAGAVRVVERTLQAGGRAVTISSSKNWYFQPAVWRTAHTRPLWRGHFRNVHTCSQPDFIGTRIRPSPDEFIDRLGIVTMGGIWEPPFLIHTGTPEHSLHNALGGV